MLFFLPAPIRLVLGVLVIGFSIYLLSTHNVAWGLILLALSIWIVLRAYSSYKKDHGHPKSKNYDK